MTYELVAVRDPADWTAFHDIRRVELFEARGRFGIYNDRHPDDVADFAHPYLLKRDGNPIGAMRLDIRDGGVGIFRLVAITVGEQRRGHGRVMARLAEERARAFGLRILHVNAAEDAVGFYEKTGWARYSWDPTELAGIAIACIQMRKLL